MLTFSLDKIHMSLTPTAAILKMSLIYNLTRLWEDTLGSMIANISILWILHNILILFIVGAFPNPRTVQMRDLDMEGEGAAALDFLPDDRNVIVVLSPFSLLFLFFILNRCLASRLRSTHAVQPA